MNAEDKKSANNQLYQLPSEGHKEIVKREGKFAEAGSYFCLVSDLKFTPVAKLISGIEKKQRGASRWLLMSTINHCTHCK